MTTTKKTSERATKAAKATGRRGRGKGGVNKSDFIRSLPRDMPAKAVVEAGAKKGMTFSQQLVYNVRAADEKGGASAKRFKKRLKVIGTPVYAMGTNDESDFRQLVVDLGVARSRQLVDDVEGALRAVVSG